MEEKKLLTEEELGTANGGAERMPIPLGLVLFYTIYPVACQDISQTKVYAE